MDHVGIAKVWRQRNQEHADSGVVLIWDGEAYGWKNVLRDPQHERPGAIAVDAEGNMFIAEGGNDYEGSAWKTESMVTPVFATPILTTSWLA
ncbi:antirestriction protein ArdR [Citrobacter freundii]|uniref:antirestriction protein ArdR n=1 Tax=Citrobacter freundii TaxID=546 RepID=UPI0023B3343F|nr:antirestriction protein ArdR [Citrobacter freundii]MDE9686627.1 antirestriction protein ArdR [Citrobacter freundii]